jgi:hypothetical protein
MEHRPPQPKPSEAHVKTDQAKFERRIKMAKQIATRQSDRDIPKTPFNNGVTSLTRLTGQEYPGLVMLTLVTLEGMLPTRSAANTALCKRFSLLLWWTLSLNVCLNKPRKTESEVQDLERKISRYLQLYRSLIGPQREMKSKCGLRIVKLHALTHFPRQYREFGSTFNYFGGFFESCIKTMAKRNLARTTRKHGRFVDELMTRYYEQQVCQFSSMVLDSKDQEKVITEHCKLTIHQSMLPHHRLSKSGFRIVYSSHAKKWLIEGKNMDQSTRLVHPLCDRPEENHWMKVLGDYLFTENIHVGEIGFKAILRDPTNSSSSDIFRCHPNLYSDNQEQRPWYDFANVQFDMGKGIVDKYPVRIRLFCEVAHDDRSTELLCVVQQFTNNEKTKKTANKMLPFLQQDRLSNQFRVVKASTIECIFLLPCKFPANVDDCIDYIVFPPQQSWDTIGW